MSNTLCWNCRASCSCLTCSILIACFFCSLSMMPLFSGLSQKPLRLASCSIVQDQTAWQPVSIGGPQAGVTPKILTYHIACVTARHRALNSPSIRAQTSSLRALRLWHIVIRCIVWFVGLVAGVTDVVMLALLLALLLAL